MKKYSWPMLAIVGILGVFSFFVVQRHRARFNIHEKATGFIKILETVEWNWYDFKFRSLPPQIARHVMVAKIDDASLSKYGRWPWNRYVYKQILDELYGLGAEVVAFDAVFSEPEFRPEELEYILSAHPEGFQGSVRSMAELGEQQVKDIADKLPQVGEGIFAAGLSNTSTVLGYIWERGSSCRVEEKMSQTPEEIQASRDKGFTPIKDIVDAFGTLINNSMTLTNFPRLKDEKSLSFLPVQCPIANRSALAAKVSYQGQFNALPEDDGIFRRAHLVAGLDTSLLEKYLSPEDIEFLNENWLKGATFFPSLALESVLAYLDRVDEGDKFPKTQFDVELGRDANGRIYTKELKLNRKNGQEHRIALLSDGSIPLRFFGSQHVIPPPIAEFSLARTDVLFSPEYQKAYGLDASYPLKNQVVIIGPTAIGVYDLRPNPVQSDAGGVFIHATAASRILDSVLGDSADLTIRYPSLNMSLAILWGVSLLVGLTTLLARGLRGTWGFLLITVGFLAADYYVFSKAFLALDAVSLLICVTLLFVGILAFKYFTEEKDRAFVKGAFEKYVSPDVVGSILLDPKKLNLGGERRELSVLFSDVRGFTNISEKMGAAELAKFMNDYLTPMTEVILEEKGTIDKYMGDAIMAIFGAPIGYPEHPSKAVEAGLRMLEKLESLKVGWAAQGLPPIDIGVGVNTGDMSVGNMGSTRIFSYTVMGDSVNLGSRLEGLTKEYGVKFIVSEFTRAKIGEAFVCRELDRVKVKGKAIPVTIFEVMGRAKDAAADELRQKGERFSSALQKYYAADFETAQKEFEELQAQDPTSEIYAERCALWREAPPPDGWDGSWTMKTK
jgi:adenylate cyclase